MPIWGIGNAILPADEVKTKQETLKELFFVPFTCYLQSINNITGYLLHAGYISKIWPFLTTSIANRHMCYKPPLYLVCTNAVSSYFTSLPPHLFSHTLNSPLVIQGDSFRIYVKAHFPPPFKTHYQSHNLLEIKSNIFTWSKRPICLAISYLPQFISSYYILVM